MSNDISTLSPKALSKKVHKINAWISPDLLKRLNKQFHANKLDKSEINTKSKLIAEALDNLYFSPTMEDIILTNNGSKTSRITFYLDQYQAQRLWDQEGHYLGMGIKRVTTSNIVQFALMEYLD